MCVGISVLENMVDDTGRLYDDNHQESVMISRVIVRRIAYNIQCILVKLSICTAL